MLRLTQSLKGQVAEAVETSEPMQKSVITRMGGDEQQVSSEAGNSLQIKKDQEVLREVSPKPRSHWGEKERLPSTSW